MSTSRGGGAPDWASRAPGRGGGGLGYELGPGEVTHENASNAKFARFTSKINQNYSLERSAKIGG
jgi:hypothetical protein